MARWRQPAPGGEERPGASSQTTHLRPTVILRGQLQPINYIKMGLTVIVPYMVSVFSSVGAIIEQGGYQPKARDEGVVRGS